MRGLLIYILVLTILSIVLEHVDAQIFFGGGGSGDGGMIIFLKDKAESSASQLFKQLQAK